MNQRSVIVIFVIVPMAGLLAGCGGPQWAVHSQATPNPFLNQRRFVVLPIDFTGLHVDNKPEAEFLAEKSADQQASFAADKQGINAFFFKALVTRAAEGGIEVFPAAASQSAPFQIHQPAWRTICRSV